MWTAQNYTKEKDVDEFCGKSIVVGYFLIILHFVFMPPDPANISFDKQESVLFDHQYLLNNVC